MEATTRKLALVVAIALSASGFVSEAAPKPGPIKSKVSNRISKTPQHTTRNVEPPDALRRAVMVRYAETVGKAPAPPRSIPRGRSKSFSLGSTGLASSLSDRRSHRPDQSEILAQHRQTIGNALGPTEPLPLKGTTKREADLRELALANVFNRSSRGYSVIGHSPVYVSDARDAGSSFFYIKPGYWRQLTPEERQQANDYFIDRRAAMKDVFVTSIGRNQIQENSALGHEVQRLIQEHHYNWNGDNRLEPPAGP